MLLCLCLLNVYYYCLIRSSISFVQFLLNHISHTLWKRATMFISLFPAVFIICSVSGSRLKREAKQNDGLFRQTQNGSSIETSRTISELKEWRSENKDALFQEKEAPPMTNPAPQCYISKCTRRKINVKVYIKDQLWDKASEADPGAFFVQKVNTYFSGINKHLARLDNGGFELVFNETVTKLSNSDITFGPTYKDRYDQSNTIREYDDNKLIAQTFSFQEAVEKLPADKRKEVNIRILFTLYRNNFVKFAFSEEECICDQGTTGYNFGCVSVITVISPTDWAYPALGAHEIGHTLGFKYHDDKYYISGRGVLMMWESVRNY